MSRRKFPCHVPPLPLSHRRFTTAYTGDVIWVRMDRSSHFDGELRTWKVKAVQEGAAGGVWETFDEADVTYLD